MRKPSARTVQILVLCTMALVAAGCHHQSAGPEQPVPDWLTSTPDDDRYLYAVGISGKTRSVKDAWNQAAQRGRAELGKIIITRVASKDLVISTNRSDYSRQVIEALSDTELYFTEVIARWYDATGTYGPPGFYYVLVRMQREEAERILRKMR
ncbi:MAG: hypothetical protein AMJ54_15120 [Deltaproteobacteria bacterium SG8_13]|nr:MAG: hypothetical protein AMJ54_15120 [Deltaproteobacteria bacterium SG8_13]